MAATPNAFTTGKDDGDVRRRNIQTHEKANGGTVYKIEAEDTKKVQKVSSSEAGVARRCLLTADSCYSKNPTSLPSWTNGNSSSPLLYLQHLLSLHGCGALAYRLLSRGMKPSKLFCHFLTQLYHVAAD